MLYNYNSFVIFILIFLISIIVSFILICLCEFKTVFSMGKDLYLSKGVINNDIQVSEHENKLSRMTIEEFQNTDDKIYSNIIDKNLTLELYEPHEILVPDTSAKKDVFINDDGELTIVTPGRPFYSKNKTKIDAFYYGEKYEIFYKKNKIT